MPAARSPKLVIHPERPTFDGLNALRGTAALSIMLLHSSDALGIIVPSGYLAVDIFFLMSGYVIAYAYERRFVAGMTLSEFIRLRVWRFYPLYIAGVILGALVVAGLFLVQWPAFPIWQPALAFVLALLFLPMLPSQYSGIGLYPLNPPSWSLAVELVVNIAYAALWRHLNDKVLVAVCAVALAAMAFDTVYTDGIGGGYNWDNIGLGYARAGFAFPLGVLFYRNAIRLSPAIPAMLAPFLLVPMLMIQPSGWAKYYDLLFVAIISPAIVLIAIGPVGAKWRSFCTFLGRTSYPLYTLHLPVIMLAMGGAKFLDIPIVATVLMGLAGLLSVCWYLDVIDERYRRILFKEAAST